VLEGPWRLADRHRSYSELDWSALGLLAAEKQG